MSKPTMPEPVAFAAGGHPNHLCSRAQYNSMLGKNRIKFDVPLITTAQAEAYAAARVREALEEAARVPRAYAESLDRQGWGNRFPDELTAIFNASTNMADRIRAMIPTDSRPGQP